MRPYVGAGLNYTNFSSVSFSSAVAALQPSIKHNSFGLAAQVGADFEVSKGLYLNVDLKKVSLGTTVYSKGAEAGKFKVNPVLASVGLGWRFLNARQRRLPSGLRSIANPSAKLSFAVPFASRP